MSLFVKKGDTVVVLAGESKGKRGKVLAVEQSKNKVVVEGVKITSRHTKPKSAQKSGGIVKKESTIDASNVQVICPSCDKPTRVHHKIDENGKKMRVCSCGKILDVKEAKADKKKDKKKDDAKAVKKEEAVKKEDAKVVEAAEEKPVKKATTKKTVAKEKTEESKAEEPKAVKAPKKAKAAEDAKQE